MMHEKKGTNEMKALRKSLDYYAEGYNDAQRLVNWNAQHKRVARDLLAELSQKIVENEQEAYHGASPRARARARREFKRLFALRAGFLDGYRAATGVDLATSEKAG